jgi:hypothetical protein
MSRFSSFVLVGAIIGLCVVFLCDPLLAASGPTGPEIYRTQCASCHGSHGQGVPDHCPDPLHGDRPLEDLAQVIADTMPEEEPERCVGEDAKKVAQFIHQTFYTEAARARNKPPRIELSRMTVRQYLNTTTDLIASFVGQGRLNAERGLKARYFNARSFKGDKKAFERVDPRISFDFGEGSPDAGKIGKAEFSIQWQGAVIAEETGDYEFCLKTENGARLWVNDTRKALIDAWVKSGDKTEHTATIRLLGGRVYPLRLDYFKFKDKKASVELRWQPPQRTSAVIPRRNLSPAWFPQQLVVETDFPPDDSSAGYERGTSVSKSWHQATTYAAIEVANKVVANLPGLAQCKDDAPNRKQLLRQFCSHFAERAFRRPLSDAQREFFVDAQFQDEPDLDAAVKKAVLLVLTSPRFLYLETDDQLDDYDVACRLSYGLWDSLPDQELLRAASQGQLRTADHIQRQSRRMLADPRTRSKLRDFFRQWLQVDRAYDVSKDKEQYPNFNAVLVSDLLTSLDLLVEDVVWSEGSDFRQLLLADYLFANQRVAEFYGLDAPDDNEFHRVPLDADACAGVLTHPYLLTAFAYHKASSPIHRGVFLVRNVLGRSLKPPPIAVAPADEGEDPSLTTRQRVAQQTNSAMCQTCHGLINPLGFSLEHYDAVGRFRAREKDKPIDASGAYKTLAGEQIRFEGARGLGEFLAASPETHRSIVQQLFHNAVKQPVSAYGRDQLRELERAFADSDYSLQDLLIEIMQASALKTK